MKDVDHFFNFMNSYEENEFDISCLPDNLLEFLDLTISFDLTSKQLLINVLGKPNKSFGNIMLSRFLTNINIEKVLEKLNYHVANFFLTNLTFFQSCWKKYEYLFAG